MIEPEMAFNDFGYMGRFQNVSFLHVVYSGEFVNLSLVDITYITKTHQELQKILKVSRAVYINTYLANICYLINILKIDFLLSIFVLCFQVCFVLTLAQKRSSWRHINKYYLILEKFEF